MQDTVSEFYVIFTSGKLSSLNRASLSSRASSFFIMPSIREVLDYRWMKSASWISVPFLVSDDDLDAMDEEKKWRAVEAAYAHSS